MYVFEDSTNAPVYLITDNQQVYDEHEAGDSDTVISEASSLRTMCTLSSGEVADYFRTVCGFTYVADENIPLTFPTDSAAERLSILYNTIIKLCQRGANVPIVADELLQKGGLDGTGARVLDLVTDSGIWVQEMASMYPNAEFLSLDVKPLTALVPHPRIDFEVYDLYAGISEPDASFDVVHARQCVMWTRNFNLLLREMHRVLKPGGVLVIEEMPCQLYEVNDPSIILHSSSCHAEAILLMRAAHASQGIDLAAWDDMHTRLDPRHPMWGNCNIDLKGDFDTIRGFHTITSFTHLIPDGPWHPDECQRVIGTMASFVFEKVWKALLPMLQIMGMEEREAQAYVDSVEKGARDPRYRSYAKYKVWCARKL